MTIKELASKIAKIEGKKSAARIGEIREILSILSDMAIDGSGVLRVLANNGIRRLKRKGKKL